MIRRNYGIVNKYGNVNAGVVGPRATYNDYRGSATEDGTGQQARRDRAAVGVITALSIETRAVRRLLKSYRGYRQQPVSGGRRFDEAWLGSGEGAMRVVLTQASEPGQRAAVVAFEQLCDYCSPHVVVLCGVAGGIDERLALGDVVLAREIIYYDMRREAPDAVHRRGQAQSLPVMTQHALNDMLAEYGEQGWPGLGKSFTVLSGPIGTGETVVASVTSEIRRYLKAYNEKMLAVETEAGGVWQAFYEQVAATSAAEAWVVIRGISDLADEGKNDSHKAMAAGHAAVVLDRLLPHLNPTQFVPQDAKRP